MYRPIRHLLFRLDPERAHQLTLSLIRAAGRFPPALSVLRRFYAVRSQPVRAFGLTFPNPVGLAAGYDKDAQAWHGLSALGFGHIEVGTVTPQPQPGNPRPRVFRLPEDSGLINRLGFPSQGADFVRTRLIGKRPAGLVLGVNIGKSKATPVERAASDYVALLEIFAPLADYITVNVSSPNTVGLRRLQARAALEDLLSQLNAVRRKLAAGSAHQAPGISAPEPSAPSDFAPAAPDLPGKTHPAAPIPILVKLSPDLSEQELADSVEAVLATGMDGIIATNTTLSREGLGSPNKVETGGLSGAPLSRHSRDMVAKIVKMVDSKIPVVGVGGVMGPQEARKLLDAGAALVQVYTGLIYSGPGLVKKILKEI